MASPGLNTSIPPSASASRPNFWPRPRAKRLASASQPAHRGQNFGLGLVTLASSSLLLSSSLSTLNVWPRMASRPKFWHHLASIPKFLPWPRPREQNFSLVSYHWPRLMRQPLPLPRGKNFGLGLASSLRRQSQCRGQKFDLEVEPRPKFYLEAGVKK